MQPMLESLSSTPDQASRREKVAPHAMSRTPRKGALHGLGSRYPGPPPGPGIDIKSRLKLKPLLPLHSGPFCYGMPSGAPRQSSATDGSSRRYGSE